MTSGYDLGRRTGVCAATGRILEPGEPCIACLCERADDEGFDRFDYAVDAWETCERPERLFSFWRTVVPEPNQKRNVFVDDELLMSLFERLADDDRPQRVAFRFVLALVLMRKRVLRSVGHRKIDSENIWLLRAKGSPPETPPIEVRDPKLSDEQVRAVSDQLGEIVQGDVM